MECDIEKMPQKMLDDAIMYFEVFCVFLTMIFFMLTDSISHFNVCIVKFLNFYVVHKMGQLYHLLLVNAHSRLQFSDTRLFVIRLNNNF